MNRFRIFLLPLCVLSTVREPDDLHIPGCAIVPVMDDTSESSDAVLIHGFKAGGGGGINEEGELENMMGDLVVSMIYRQTNDNRKVEKEEGGHGRTCTYEALTYFDGFKGGPESAIKSQYRDDCRLLNEGHLYDSSDLYEQKQDRKYVVSVLGESKKVAYTVTYYVTSAMRDPVSMTEVLESMKEEGEHDEL